MSVDSVASRQENHSWPISGRGFERFWFLGSPTSLKSVLGFAEFDEGFRGGLPKKRVKVAIFRGCPHARIKDLWFSLRFSCGKLSNPWLRTASFVDTLLDFPRVHAAAATPGIIRIDIVAFDSRACFEAFLEFRVRLECSRVS